MVTALQEIMHYVTANGKVPYQEWVLQLADSRMDEIVHARINRLRLGDFGDCKALGGGVYELRIHYGSGYRIYFGRYGQSIILLLCGGDKRKQSWDIMSARHYWKDFQERMK